MVSRGQRQERIVRDDADRIRFCDTLEEEWRSLRRGWYLDSEEFHYRRLDQMDTILQRQSPLVLRGIRDHGERAALGWIEKALKVLGLEASELPRTKKSDPRKQVVACWLRQRTTMNNRRIAAELLMGNEVSVSQAVCRVHRKARAATSRSGGSTDPGH